MTKINENLLYSETHHWVKLEENKICVIGLTDYAQEKLGEFQFIDLPEPGENIFKGQEYASIVTDKLEKELIAPVSGNVIEINPEISVSPELINTSPYKAGWLLKVKLFDESEIKSLLSPEEYRDKIYYEEKEDEIIE